MTDFRSYVSFDLETTGIDPSQDRIIEVGAVKVVDGEVKEKYNTFLALDESLDPIISIITGIHDEDLVGAPSFLQVQENIKSFIGDLPIMGHNVIFDLNFLKANGLEFENPVWDTSVLSTILFPEMRSHSLETLSRKFKIAHEAHRALGDAKATSDLWLYLLKEVSLLEEDKKKVLSETSSRSEWGMKNIWQYDDSDADYSPLSFSSKKSELLDEVQVSIDNKALSLECFGVDRKQLTVSALNDILKNYKKCLLVGAYYFFQDTVLNEFPDSTYLDRPESYLDWNAFREFMQKDSLADGEIVFACKILRSFEEGDVVHRGKLSFMPQDFEYWDQVSCARDSEVYVEIQKSVLESNLLGMSQYGFFQHIEHDPGFFEGFDFVVFLDGQLLEQNLTSVFGLSLDSRKPEEEEGEFLEKIQAWISASVPDSPFPQSIMINEGLKNDVYRQLKQDAENTKSPVLKAFFGEGKDSVSWVKIDPRGYFSIHVSPIHIDVIFREKILDKIAHLFISDRGFCAECIGFDGERREVISKEFCSKFSVTLPAIEEITGTKKEGDVSAQMEYFSRTFLSIKGRCALVFSSRRVLQKFFIALQPWLVKNNIPYIVEGVTGGRGKMLELYEESFEAERVLFFCTHRFLPLFLREDLQFHNIFFQSLPFDPFGDPVIQARNNSYKNGFMEYYLPKALQSFGVLFDKMTLEDEEKKAFFLDRRLHEKSYAEEFLRFFPKTD